MLKIQYCSDLHLEFPENSSFLKANPIKAEGDILIMAGDIVPFTVLDKYNWFFDEVSEKFKQVFWIPGNHEYYYSDISLRSGCFSEVIRKNITLLNNQVVELEDIRFVFSTLWTKISEHNQWHIMQRLSDFHVISNLSDNFTSTKYNDLHTESLTFIKEVLNNKTTAKSTVVATHHVPTFMNYPDEYKGSVLNEAFAVELFDLIGQYQPDVWIYGHSHGNMDDFTIGKTNLVTNQLGYVSENEHKIFDGSKVYAL